MLTARIMHECVRKLLSSNPSDEEALECLCRLDFALPRLINSNLRLFRLLTTVGQDLEKETSDRLSKGAVPGLCDLASYFKVLRSYIYLELVLRILSVGHEKIC